MFKNAPELCKNCQNCPVSCFLRQLKIKCPSVWFLVLEKTAYQRWASEHWFSPHKFAQNRSLLTEQKTRDKIGRRDLLIQNNPEMHRRQHQLMHGNRVGFQMQGNEPTQPRTPTTTTQQMMTFRRGQFDGRVDAMLECF